MGPLLRSARATSLLALIALLVPSMFGCQGEAEPSPLAAPSSPIPSAAATAPDAPTDNPAAALGIPQVAAAHVVVKAAGNCQEWNPGSPPRTIVCPADLQDGETIRFLTSTTCTRVGAAGREGSVTCPETRAP